MERWNFENSNTPHSITPLKVRLLIFVLPPPAGWKAGKLMARKYATLRFHLPAINFPAIFGARAESESRGFRRAAETCTPAACAPRCPRWLELVNRNGCG